MFSENSRLIGKSSTVGPLAGTLSTCPSVRAHDWFIVDSAVLVPHGYKHIKQNYRFFLSYRMFTQPLGLFSLQSIVYNCVAYHARVAKLCGRTVLYDIIIQFWIEEFWWKSVLKALIKLTHKKEYNFRPNCVTQTIHSTQIHNLKYFS